MGRILKFLDFNQASTSRKLVAHKRHTDGLEAPRNSLEFPMEASQTYHVIQEDIPYSCQLKQHSSKMKIYPNGTSMKKLIDEEMSKRTHYRRNAPSVVARLMGMDPFPSEAKPVVHAKEWNDEKLRINIPRKLPTEASTMHHISHSLPLSMKATKQEKVSSSSNYDPNYRTKSSRLKKPQTREHHQEELLQKFKKEFEAWQASKIWERSQSIKLDDSVQWGRENQILAQEKLNREKLARYMDAKRKSVEPKEYVSAHKLKIKTQQMQQDEYSKKQFHSNLKDDIALRIGAKANNSEHLAIDKFDNKEEEPSSPTRIVILKPSSERSDEVDESWSGSTEISDKEGSMKDFLEELRERLRSEIQGLGSNCATKQIHMTETCEISLGESSADPRQLARHIAKQIRESVIHDLGTTLMRSESTRSYRSELQFNGSNSPEFINRDTRKILTERLKNVLKNETDTSISLTNNEKSATSLSLKQGLRLKPVSDFSKTGKKMSNWEERKVLNESKTRCLSHGRVNGMVLDTETVSPRNLVRSFSAPVSGTAFGKLLLEDQHVLTGAHIRRKHEVSGHNSPEMRKSKKDVFNIKGKVSNLRQNFTLKGKLFWKKNQSMDNLALDEFDPMKALVTTPSVVMNSGFAQDNSTEVPPSPASVSSGSHDELCRPGHPSPVSPLEVPFTQEHQSPQDSGELSSSFPEMKTTLEQAENVECEEMATEEIAIEGNSCAGETTELEGHAQAYVRDILVTAGLYGSQYIDQTFPRWDALTKPITKWVFEEVEEVCSRARMVDNNAGGSLLDHKDTNIEHKLLFDLVNEALPRVIHSPMTSSTFKKWVLGPTTLPHGKKLLDDLWPQIQTLANPSVDEAHSLDSIVAWDMKMTPWSSLSHEDIDTMGIEMEGAVLGCLIDEFVCDLSM